MADKPAQNPEQPSQVALLIDGENISADFAGAIIMRPKVKINEHPRKKWHSYLTSKPEFYDCDPKGPNACVRLKNP